MTAENSASGHCAADRCWTESGVEEGSGMKEAAFRAWLKLERGLNAGTVGQSNQQTAGE